MSLQSTGIDLKTLTRTSRYAFCNGDLKKLRTAQGKNAELKEIYTNTIISIFRECCSVCRL